MVDNKTPMMMSNLLVLVDCPVLCNSVCTHGFVPSDLGRIDNELWHNNSRSVLYFGLSVDILSSPP